MARRMLLVGSGLLAALVLLSSPALAQITTGTVSGTVKDATGGVIPGATVVLISETRGTKSAPAVTNETGTYVFPNVTPDTYTVEVTLEAFKTVRRAGIAVSGGDRVGMPAITLEPGAVAETVTVIGESPLVQTQSGERSYAVTSNADRQPADRAREFHQPDRLHPGRRAHGRVGRRHPSRRRRTEQHHDGRHLGDGHRQQRPDAEHERRRDRRSEDPDPGLPGRVRPLERPADHGRHQERLEQVQRLRLRHHDQLGLGREQLGQREERRSEAEDQHQDAGLHHRRPRRASRAATTSCSSSTRTSIVR